MGQALEWISQNEISLSDPRIRWSLVATAERVDSLIRGRFPDGDHCCPLQAVLPTNVRKERPRLWEISQHLGLSGTVASLIANSADGYYRDRRVRDALLQATGLALEGAEPPLISGGRRPHD